MDENANREKMVKITMALTAYDRKREGKKDYNRYALPQYLQALYRVAEDIKSGFTLRHALCFGFSGRVLDVALKAVGEAPATEDEQEWGC